MVRKDLENHLSSGKPVAYWTITRHALGDQHGVERGIIAAIDQVYEVRNEGTNWRAEDRHDGVEIKTGRGKVAATVPPRNIIGTWDDHLKLRRKAKKQQRDRQVNLRNRQVSAERSAARIRDHIEIVDGDVRVSGVGNVVLSPSAADRLVDLLDG